MGFLAGKKLLITGVLSNRSIAYGIARACHQQGAELAFSYVGERFKERITEFAAEFDSKLIFDCDVGSDEQIDQMFKDLATHWPQFSDEPLAQFTHRVYRVLAAEAELPGKLGLIAPRMAAQDWLGSYREFGVLEQVLHGFSR